MLVHQVGEQSYFYLFTLCRKLQMYLYLLNRPSRHSKNNLAQVLNKKKNPVFVKFQLISLLLVEPTSRDLSLILWQWDASRGLFSYLETFLFHVKSFTVLSSSFASRTLSGRWPLWDDVPVRKPAFLWSLLFTERIRSDNVSGMTYREDPAVGNSLTRVLRTVFTQLLWSPPPIHFCSCRVCFHFGLVSQAALIMYTLC